MAQRRSNTGELDAEGSFRIAAPSWIYIRSQRDMCAKCIILLGKYQMEETSPERPASGHRSTGIHEVEGKGLKSDMR